MKDKFTLSKIQKIRSFKKNNLGYLRKDIKEVSKDLKDKGLYTILSAGMAVMPLVNCGTDNPDVPIPKAVTYSVVMDFPNTTSFNGQIQTDVGIYAVNGPTVKAEYLNTGSDATYTSDKNMTCVVNADGSGNVALVRKDQGAVIQDMIDGTVARFEGKQNVWVPEDNVNLGVADEKGYIKNKVNDTDLIKRTLQEAPFDTMYNIVDNEASAAIRVYVNAEANRNTLATRTGKLTSGALEFTDGVAAMLVRAEAAEIDIGSDNVGRIPDYVGLYDGSSAFWTNDDTSYFNLNTKTLKITATMTPDIIYNK